MTTENLEARKHFKELHSAAELIDDDIKCDVVEIHGVEAIFALVEWHNLQIRNKHPDGKFDSAGRFYADCGERHECCDYICPPSRSFPYSEMAHCRSLLHVSTAHGTTPEDVKNAALAVIRVPPLSG